MKLRDYLKDGNKISIKNLVSYKILYSKESLISLLVSIFMSYLYFLNFTVDKMILIYYASSMVVILSSIIISSSIVFSSIDPSVFSYTDEKGTTRYLMRILFGYYFIGIMCVCSILTSILSYQVHDYVTNNINTLLVLASSYLFLFSTLSVAVKVKYTLHLTLFYAKVDLSEDSIENK